VGERKKLTGWKEIGAHLGVSDRTARRWEANGLPVHRLFPDQKSLIYAWADELDTWYKGQSQGPALQANRQRFWRVAGVFGALLCVAVIYSLLRPAESPRKALVAKPLTLGNELDYSPAISPDGQRMAFSRYTGRTGFADLWLYEFRTGKEEQLIKSDGVARGPAWSPDGRTIAFIRGSSEYEAELVVVNVESRQERVLASFSRARLLFPRGQEVAWMPDGKRILYPRQVENRLHAELRAIDLASGREELLERQENQVIRNPAYSPGGKHLAYLRRSSGPAASEDTHQLFVVEVDENGKPKGAAHLHSNEILNCASFYWLDAKRLLRVIVQQRSRRLEIVRLGQPEEMEVVPIPESQFHEVVYHPGTARMAYSRFSWDLDNVGYPVVNGRIETPGKAYAQTKDNEFALSFHPEDGRAAVASGGRGPSEIFVVNEDGSKRQVSDSKSELAAEIAWSNKKEELYHLALSGGKLRLFQQDLVGGATLERLSNLNFSGVLQADPNKQGLWATIDNHKLIRINRDSWKHEEFAQDVRQLAVAPDGGALYALRSDGSLWKLDVANKQEQRMEVPAAMTRFPLQKLAASRKRLWVQRKVSPELMDLIHFTFADRTWRETGFQVRTRFPSLAVRPDDTEVGVVVFENFDSDLIEVQLKL
jgi:Tol biopolymer transport system component